HRARRRRRRRSAAEADVRNAPGQHRDRGFSGGDAGGSRMKTAIVLFPGTNRERDMAAALRAATGQDPKIVWHAEPTLPDADLIVLPGGFSFGDYLRSGAIAARSPIMADVVRRAEAGTLILGVCNGFQTLCEAGLLPGVLMRNA